MSARGTLPNGWTLGDSEHIVNILDDDLSVGFVRTSDDVDEPSNDTDHTIDIRISNAPTANITLEVTHLTASTANTTSAGGAAVDVTYSPTTVTFTAGDSANLTKTVTLNVKSDSLKESAEYLELRLGNSDGSLTSGGNMFSFGNRNYRLNINANGNEVSIDSENSDDRLNEDGGTANIVVKVDEPSPAEIILNVSAESASTANGETDYTVPSTMRIGPDSDTGTFTITGVNDETEDRRLTIDLELTGTLPGGWDFTPSDPLTHQIVIVEDDGSKVGWTEEETEHTVGSSTTTYTTMVELSKSPTRDILLSATFGGSATRGVDFFLPANGCNSIRFAKDATGDDLTLSCNVRINPSAASKTITMTIVDSEMHLTTDSISIDPAVQTITVNSQ